MVIKWMKRIKWMRLSKYFLVITMSLSLVFCGFTVYGARVGNFNIYLHGDDVQLAIYMEEDMSDLGTHLSVPVLDEMDNTTFEDIATRNIRSKIMTGLGPKNDEDHRQYLAFSFVLVNFSEGMVNYDLELTVISTREGMGGGKVEAAMRVLIIKEWDYQLGSTYEALTKDEEQDAFYRSGSFYALAEKSDEDRAVLAENTYYTTQDFISEVQLLRQEEYDFEPLAQVKYTVVIWLEGWDNDCVNSIYGGRIKMRLDIVGRL
ncbi:MAG: hypothetical protein J1F36_03760 [Clostridiales bacterium]|nr:hypothetical protein [Clostridiales bacterium]